MYNSSSCKLLDGEYATRETVTTVSCFDHLLTLPCSQTKCISLIKCLLLDHLGLHHITSSELKGKEEIVIKIQRDLSKINDAQYLCLFLLRSHFDLQKLLMNITALSK